MRHAFQIFSGSTRDLWDEMFILTGAGLVTFILMLTVVGAPPALAGLFHLTLLVVRKKRVEFGDFWVGFRRYFWSSWKLLGLGLVVTVVMAANIAYCLSPQQHELVLRLMGWINVYALIVWLGTQVYALPLLVRMEDQRTFPILRNALLLCLGYPLFTLTLLALLTLTLIISVAVPLLLPLTYLPTSALVGHHALRAAVEDVERKQAET
ncbi:MAG: hypothetical protein SVX38_03180 [Chloroflexota bacterium]|nr:hypothetical protein [Chloroflexota bacterium]